MTSTASSQPKCSIASAEMPTPAYQVRRRAVQTGIEGLRCGIPTAPVLERGGDLHFLGKVEKMNVPNPRYAGETLLRYASKLKRANSSLTRKEARKIAKHEAAKWKRKHPDDPDDSYAQILQDLGHVR